MDIYVITTSINGTMLMSPQEISRSDKRLTLLKRLDGISLHTFRAIAHIGMYRVGGDDLYTALRHHSPAVPDVHCLVVAVLTGIAYALDCVRLYMRYHNAERETWFEYAFYFRRLCIMIARVPSNVTLLLMMSIPTKLCQDLIRTAMAVDGSSPHETQYYYTVFWQHLNTGRRWYNAAMPAYFLAAVSRIPISVYSMINLDVRRRPGWQTTFMFLYAACDTVKMVFWLQPAIAIRRNHGVLMRATVASSCHQTEEATMLATMMATLHPFAGLKMLGFLVSWRMVTHFVTFASVIWTCLGLLTDAKRS